MSQLIDLNKGYTPSNLGDWKALKEEVFNIPPELIYYKYLGPTFKVGGVTSSPFRSDSNPSFGIFRNDEGDLVYNDLGQEGCSGDSFSFIYKYYRKVLKIDSLKGCLDKLKKDFSDISNLDMTTIYGDSSKNLKKARYSKKSNFKLEVKIVPFEKADAEYWKQFGINLSTLSLFNVFAISHYFINGKGFKADKLAYAYIEYKDDEFTIKVYQPHSRKMKWIANINFSIHQGYRVLPPEGDLLIHTKALKDVMSLYCLPKISSIGVQGEKARVKLSVINEYKSRFKINLCLFDNDNEGRNLSKYFKNHYDIDYILVPDKYECKDFSDLVKKLGPKEATSILLQLINNYYKEKNVEIQRPTT